MKNFLCAIVIFYSLINCKVPVHEEVLPSLGLLWYRLSHQTVSGTAIKGVMRNAGVIVSSLQSDGTCSTGNRYLGTTNSKGDYSMTFPSMGGAFCLSVTANSQGTSTMYDEKTNKYIPLKPSFNLTTIFPESKIANNRRSGLIISPFSRLLTKRVRYLMKKEPNVSVSSLHSRAGRELVTRFGLNKGLGLGSSTKDNSDTPELEDILINLQNPNSPLSAKFLVILVGFSQMASQYKSSDDILDNLDAILEVFANDFADGSFDGKDESGQSITIGVGSNQLNLPSTPLSSVLLPSMQKYFSEGGKFNFGTGTFTPSFDTTQITNAMSFIDNTPITPGSQTYSIGGSISGLTANGLVLQNNGSSNTTINSGATSFTIGSVAQGSAYNVTIFTQPSGLTCTVSNGSGTALGNITNITITCIGVPAPILHWAFENNLTPSVGSGSLTLVGGSTSYATGYNGNGSSLVFSVGTYYNFSGSTVTANQNKAPSWTVAFWIYPTTGGDTSQAVVSGSTNWHSIKAKQSDGKVGLTKTADDSFSHTLSLNTWTHVVVVSNGSTAQLYINGSLDSSLNTTSATTLGLPLHRLGAIYSNNSDKFAGRIDELRIYDTNLTSSQVSNLYNSY